MTSVVEASRCLDLSLSPNHPSAGTDLSTIANDYLDSQGNPNHPARDTARAAVIFTAYEKLKTRSGVRTSVPKSAGSHTGATLSPAPNQLLLRVLD
ncbi:hypothetical protein CKAH01_12459 [Colletotrichum kahawae]|uniref:Uncharacterized protein n=1 Tax=Colletotrichum kahawae TaxID=34407 RepID=A0AAE0DCS5_COLKA|nr:hypothetical protein CKAH01_12459 [Colletotrichum kahawae]